MLKSFRPTNGELAILGQLWTLKRATVRQIYDAMTVAGSTVGYTTVLKLLQIMTEKGLVQRNEADRTHIYSACAGAEKTQRQLVKDLLHRAFNNSAQQLVVQALSAKPVSKDELREIRELIERFEKEQQ